MPLDSNQVVVIGAVPKASGPFTFYRHLRPRILKDGFDVKCVTLGADQASLWEDSFADEGCVRLAEDIHDLKTQAREFVRWCESAGVSIVIAINSAAILAALPHLPKSTRVVSRVASIFDSGYRNTVTCHERLARIVATTPRHRRDLVQEYGADPNRLVLIPNGVSADVFEAAAAQRRGRARRLRIGFLGRLDHIGKGVLFLPTIVRRLRSSRTDFELTFAGKGAYERGLKRRLRQEVKEGIVQFVGQLSPTDVPRFLSEIDVVAFTSQSEGCPNTLLEAMMAGCVPVTWHLDGITDFIVEDGRTGFVCELGDCNAFSDRIAQLAHDRDLLAALANSAALDARKRFSARRMAADYAGLFSQVLAEPAPSWSPLHWGQFASASAEHTNWQFRGRLGRNFKSLIRRALFYSHLSDRFE